MQVVTYVRDVITMGTARVSMAIINYCIVKHSVALLSASVIQYIGMEQSNKLKMSATLIIGYHADAVSYLDLLNFVASGKVLSVLALEICVFPTFLQ